MRGGKEWLGSHLHSAYQGEWEEYHHQDEGQRSQDGPSEPQAFNIAIIN